SMPMKKLLMPTQASQIDAQIVQAGFFSATLNSQNAPAASCHRIPPGLTSKSSVRLHEPLCCSMQKTSTSSLHLACRLSTFHGLADRDASEQPTLQGTQALTSTLRRRRAAKDPNLWELQQKVFRRRFCQVSESSH